MKKTDKEIVNCLVSELSNLLSEHKSGTLTDDDIYGYFRRMLLDSGLDSKIIVKVLEDEHFKELGREHARYIKVDEGW